MSTVEGLTLVGLVVTLGVAIVGWVQGNRANARARVANEHAAAANDMAAQALALTRAAEDRAGRIEAQANEPRDVLWEKLDERDHTALAFRNVGSDDAHNVVLIVDHVYERWPRRTEPSGTVLAGHRVAMNLATEQAEERDRTQRTRESTSSTFAIPALDLRARITWTTPSGVTQHQDFPAFVI